MELKGNDLVGAYALGKYDGIGTAETIFALAVSKTIEAHDLDFYGYAALNTLRQLFKEECARYRADINTPVTEEQKQELLKNTI